MLVSSCHFCGSSETRVFRKPKRHEKVQLSIAECTRCSLLFADPFPTTHELMNQYDVSYFNSTTPIEGGYENYQQDEPIIRKTFDRRLNDLSRRKLLPTRGAALDVGCATGVFLEALRDRRWDVSGIEVSSFARTIARDKGFSIDEKPIEKSDYPENTFDLITLWDVIEHVSDPVSTLQACWRLLKKGGHIALTTPDASALLPRLLGTYWMGFRCVGEHVYFFRRDAMTRVLERAGFRVVDRVSVGKYFSLSRFLTRLSYYTRILRIFKFFNIKAGGAKMVFYISSGDTMLVIARKD